MNLRDIAPGTKWRVPPDLQQLDAIELIREAIECSVRHRQCLWALSDYGVFDDGDLSFVVKMVADNRANAADLDDLKLTSLLNKIRRHGAPPRDPSRLRRLLD